MHNLSCENEFYLHKNEKWFPYQRLSTYPRFETEAQWNSEMAYSSRGVSDYARDKVSRGTPEAVPSLVRCNLRFVFRKIQHLFGHLHRNFLPKPGGSTRKERVQESEMCNNYTKIIKLHIVWAMSTKDEIWFDDAPMKFSVFIAWPITSRLK